MSLLGTMLWYEFTVTYTLGIAIGYPNWDNLFGYTRSIRAQGELARLKAPDAKHPLRIGGTK